MQADREMTAAPQVLVVRKVKQILASFTVEEPELTLHQITERTGLPATTCQRLVQNLLREGFVDRDGDRYRIGLGLVRLAAPGTFGLDLVRLTHPVLQRLRDETGETACLYVRDGEHRTIVALAESRHPVIRLFIVGMVMPLHAGSGGKVFLAWDPVAHGIALAHGLSRYTPSTIVDADELAAQLDDIRKAGYSVSFEERDYGAASISAPVFDLNGDMVAAVGIGAPTQRLGPSDVDRFAPAVVAAAEEASRRLGHCTGV